MAVYNFNLHNFAYVEHTYNNTNPIRGTNIVPMGDRRRKWECIIKVSPHCYMLSDCGEHADITNAAVVWTRNADSTDTVEYRNKGGDYAHTGRYWFLSRCMTTNMLFIVDGGKQYIRYDDKRYFLPKDPNKSVGFTASRTEEYNASQPTYRYTGVQEWTFTSEPHPLPVTRVRVNKERKAPYKESIDEYLHWAWTMAPILEGTMDWKSNSNALAQSGHMRGSPFLELLNDTQHENRTVMLHAFLTRLAESTGNRYWRDIAGNTFDGGLNVSLTSDPKKFRTKFNAWVNDMGEFNDSFEEYREVK